MEEKKGKKVCSDGDSDFSDVLMETICDNIVLTAKTYKQKKRGWEKDAEGG